MYVYLITNLVNNKKYVGITNDYKKRWSNHRSMNSPSMAIAKAIKKYGKENFKFELLEENVSIEDIDEKEQYYIQQLETHVSTGKGYNVSKGGRYNICQEIDTRGHNNNHACLTKEEVEYIKSHRDLPMYVLYDDFAEKITYQAFRKIYNDQTYKEIPATVSPYPYNNAFSSQFATTGKLSYSEVIGLREQYANQVPWREAYEPYRDIYPNEMSFWNIYVGNRYKLVMPEIFTRENKHFQSVSSHSGENNGRAKLTKEDVVNMRKWFESGEKTRKEIQASFPHVSTATINSILRYASWKNI